jgi:putative ABC transport system permease protein
VLERLFQSPLQLGLAQAGVAIVLALGVVLLARRQRIHLEKETLVALARGLVQVVAVGSVLLLLFKGPLLLGIPALLAMVAAAGATAARRAAGIPGAWWISLAGVGAGAGSVIVVMTALGVIDPALSSLIPVGSMLIANAMNSGALALDRFRSEIHAHGGEIEAALALGAEPRQIVVPYVEAAVHASMIPRIDSMRSLGIVWIPGLMAGMILSGEDPIYAAVYQFVVIAMIYGSSALTSILCTLLIRTRAFTPAMQLALKPAPDD